MLLREYRGKVVSGDHQYNHCCSGSDGGTVEKVCRYQEAVLGAMGCKFWDCSCILAYWMACQEHTSSGKTIFQLSEMAEN